jgi:hypothetical protein
VGKRKREEDWEFRMGCALVSNNVIREGLVEIIIFE